MIDPMSDREFQLLNYLIETKYLTLDELQIIDRWLSGDPDAAPNWQGEGGIRTAISWLNGKSDRAGVR